MQDYGLYIQALGRIREHCCLSICYGYGYYQVFFGQQQSE